MNVPCILPAKKGNPPPAKADCVSASGKTRPFAPTVRADLQLHYVVLGACLWGHCQGKWWHSAQPASLLNPSSNQSFDPPLQQCQDAFLRSNPREIWGSDFFTKLGSFVLDQSQVLRDSVIDILCAPLEAGFGHCVEGTIQEGWRVFKQRSHAFSRHFATFFRCAEWKNGIHSSDTNLTKSQNEVWPSLTWRRVVRHMPKGGWIFHSQSQALGLFWTWLDTVRMWNLGAFRTWAFLKIKWKCCSRVFNQLQADSQPAFVLCIECFDWLALESNAMSWGLKDTLFLWDLDDMFVHNPAISSLTWGNWYGLSSFSGQLFFGL